MNLGANVLTLSNFSLLRTVWKGGQSPSEAIEGHVWQQRVAPARVSFHQLPKLMKHASLRHRILQLVPPQTSSLSGALRIKSREAATTRAASPLARAQRQPEEETRGDQICLLQPEESSCRHTTPVNHAGGGRLLREALIGESPNKAVRSHPRIYLLDQHFQNRQRKPKERSREGTETGEWREVASPRLVLDAWAVPGEAGKGASFLVARGCRGSSLPRSLQRQEQTGRGGPQLQTRALRRRVPRSAQPLSRLAPTSAGPGAGAPPSGPDPWGCGGGSAKLAGGGGGERQPGLQGPSRGRLHGRTALVPLPWTGRRCCCRGLREPLWLC